MELIRRNSKLADRTRLETWVFIVKWHSNVAKLGTEQTNERWIVLNFAAFYSWLLVLPFSLTLVPTLGLGWDEG